MVATAESTLHGQGVNGHDSTARKPRILVCTSPVTGHTLPLVRIANELHHRGYDITFIGAAEFHDGITSFGGKVVKYPALRPEDWVEREAVPPGIPRLQWDMSKFFISPTETRMQYLYKTLETMQEEDPSWPIVIVTESFFMGTVPMYLGAPLPKGFTKRPPIVNIHAAPYVTTSMSVAPFGLGMPPDNSPEGLAKIKAIYEDMAENGPFKPLLDLQDKVYKGLQAKDYVTPVQLFDTWTLAHDVTLQMCPPSLEYERADVPSKIRFAGAVTPRSPKKSLVYPPFWDEVTNGTKKVVAVTQGTVAREYEHIIMPTIQALADRDDLIVVAILGAKGATLPADFEVPSNAKILDYFPYDALLANSDVFVLNAGYGGFTHGMVNGVPMVMGGDTEDKPEVSMRGECAGIGINLRTGSPTVEQLREAVDKILTDDKYKKRVTEIQKENEGLKAMDTVEKAILEFAALA